MVNRVLQGAIDAWPIRIFFVGFEQDISLPLLVCDRLLKGPDVIETTTHT